MLIMAFFTSIRAISMRNFSTTFGASRLAKKGQVLLTEVGE